MAYSKYMLSESRVAVTLAPHSADAYLELASRLEQLARKNERNAISASVAPNAAPHIQHHSDATQEAEHAYRTAIRLAPNGGDGYYQLGSMLRALGPPRAAEAEVFLQAAAVIEPDHAAATSTAAYMLLASQSAEQRRRGLSLLARGVAAGTWPNARHWQHPAEYLPMVPTLSGVHSPRPYRCLLQPLQASAAALGAEAVAALPHFSVQPEGIARPHGGWRDLNIWELCGLSTRVGGGDAAGEGDGGLASVGPHDRATDRAPLGVLMATCTALRRAKRTYPYVQGAFFSSLEAGTSLLPHCGPTNGRLVMHVGLRVPHPGAARLRIGRPSTLNFSADETTLRQLGWHDSEPTEVVWREGEGFVWDDSQCHEVLYRQPHRTDEGSVAGGVASRGVSGVGTSNESAPAMATGQRIILLLLLLHPIMTQTPVCPMLDGPSRITNAKVEGPSFSF